MTVPSSAVEIQNTLCVKRTGPLTTEILDTMRPPPSLSQTGSAALVTTSPKQERGRVLIKRPVLSGQLTP